MRIIAWLAAGFALLSLKGYLDQVGGFSLMLGGVPVTGSLLTMIALLGSSTCFYRALRSALAGIVRGVTANPSVVPLPPEARPRAASRIFAAPAEEEFDADAAFARYMEQREAKHRASDGAVTPLPADPQPRPQFGRRVL